MLTFALISAAEGQEKDSVRVGLASLRRAATLEAGVEKVLQTLQESHDRGVDIACFPETYLPGLRGADRDLPAVDQKAMERALNRVSAACRKHDVTAILGLEWKSELGLENRAYVISGEGEILGYQTKNQITPGGESENYVADGQRQMFEAAGARFGISICHEARGAQIVFQPQVTGADHLEPHPPAAWGESFYEKAMQCRAEENSVYFVSVNRAMQRQNSASSVIDPKGDLVEFTPRGDEQLLVVDLDLTQATGLYADRYQPALYEERLAEPETDSPRYRLPFRDQWFVMAGGDTPNVNHHMKERSQQFGVDFMKTGGPNNRSVTRGEVGVGKVLEDFYSWEAPVLSPVDGVVRVAHDGERDNPVGERDAENAFGNYVMIEAAPDEFVYIAHLKKGTITVEPGARVVAGQGLGKCGNSGNSSGPHIHMHIQNSPKPYFGEGQNVMFRGIDVRQSGQLFDNVDWALLQGQFVSQSSERIIPIPLSPKILQ